MNSNIEVITENLWAVNFSFVKMGFIKELSFNNKGDVFALAGLLEAMEMAAEGVH